MEIPANLLVSQLKAQRNAALDEVAMAIAQCHHLMEENAKLKELSDKQQGLLAEADKLMSDMVKEKDVPRGARVINVKDLNHIGDVGHTIMSGNVFPSKELLKKIRLPTGKKRTRRTKAQMVFVKSGNGVDNSGKTPSGKAGANPLGQPIAPPHPR